MAKKSHTTNPTNVIPFPKPPPKTVTIDVAGPFTIPMLANTDVIGGTVYDTIYRSERVLVDPDAELEDDCLIVMQFYGGEPRVRRWQRTGRDCNGRFIRAGDPREAFFNGCFLYATEHLSSDRNWWRILGRVVGEPCGFYGKH